jgi:hypothetical protein
MHWTQDRENLSGLYETKLISEVIREAFFKNKRAIGVEFQSYCTILNSSSVMHHIQFWLPPAMIFS